MLVAILAALVVPSAFAKDSPAQVIVWPQSGTPILRFTFGKFKEVGSLGSERTYVTETTAENLWSKPISNANFSLYVFDRNKTRIAEATINVSNIAPGETVKFQLRSLLLARLPRCPWLRDMCPRNSALLLLRVWSHSQ